MLSTATPEPFFCWDSTDKLGLVSILRSLSSTHAHPSAGSLGPIKKGTLQVLQATTKRHAAGWRHARRRQQIKQNKNTLTSSLPSIVDVKMMLPLFLLPLLCSNCTQITMKTRATMMIRRRRAGLPSWGRSRANMTHEYYRGLND